MDITDTLKQEKALLIEMLSALEDERHALIKDDIEKIQELQKSKEDLKDRIDQIENARIEKYGTQRLKEILPNLNGSIHDEAEKLGSDMVETVYKIQQVNETNSMLIKQSLSYTKVMMNILSPPKVTVYGQSGHVQDRAQTSSILNKSI